MKLKVETCKYYQSQQKKKKRQTYIGCAYISCILYVADSTELYISCSLLSTLHALYVNYSYTYMRSMKKKNA